MHPLRRLLPLLLACPAPLLAACDPEADAASGSSLVEHRALAEAHASGRALDSLASARQLLVDPRLTVDAEQVRFFLLSGALADNPATLAALRSARDRRGGFTREILLGGEDARRPAVFEGIAAGAYTVCVLVGPPRDPVTAALVDRGLEHYEADSGGELSSDKLEAAVARARAEIRLEPPKLAWDACPLQCKQIDVTADPASRAVTFDDI